MPEWTDLPAFIFAIGVVIFIHELGHLLVAKLFNIRVLAFSLGFGKRLWGFTSGETEYKLSLVPLGGYVKLSGEHAGEEETSDPRDFVNRPRWQRILVYLAGPLMNVILAILVVAGLLTIGIEMEPRRVPPVLGLVADGSPAAAAGLAADDRILSIDGEAVRDFQSLQMKVLESPGKPLRVEYARGDEKRTATLTPTRDEIHGIGDAGFLAPGRAKVVQVVPGQPAEAAGFLAGDIVLRVAGRAVSLQQDFVAYIQQHPDESVDVEVQREPGNTQVVLQVVPRGEKGSARVGVLIRPSYYQRYPPAQALAESLHYNLDMIRQIFSLLGKVFTRKVSAQSTFAGPMQIADMAGDMADRGFKDLMLFVALISISIGVMNVLPIPILDGGQIATLLVESVLRRDLSLAAKERLAQVGLVIIVGLMIMVFVFDGQKALLEWRNR